MGYEGKLEIKQRCHEEALRIVRDLGDRILETALLNNLGWAKKRADNASGAESDWLAALRIEREIGYRKHEAQTLGFLSLLAAQQGDYRKAQSYFEESLKLARETEDRYGESATLCNASLLSQSLGNYELAFDQALAALTLAQAIGNLDVEQYAHVVLGHARVGLGQWDAAADSYRAALALQRQQDDRFNIAESLAGLARVALAQGDLPGALEHVEEILRIIAGREIDAENGPVHIHLTCYQVLNAMNDPRADDMLRAGYEVLQREASKIVDESFRNAYLESVTYYRELMAVWKARP
jgi:tetratricopeptide (TPR) repeat protein